MSGISNGARNVIVENSMTTNEYGLSVSISSDNTKCATQEVCVTIPGNVDGDFNVDILDVVKIIGIYVSKHGDPQFNPNSDIDNDGVIIILDVVVCTSRYAQKYP